MRANFESTAFYTPQRMTISSLSRQHNFRLCTHFEDIHDWNIAQTKILFPIMRAEDQKRIAAHYGALCGLRSEAESDSDDSTTSGHSQLQELTTSSMPPNHCAVRRPRPESLTLPFENRERESHLVSEEEFDRIIRQEELKNPLPPLPTGIEYGTSGTGLRRSISTARNTGISMMSHRTRAMSAEFNGIATSTSEQHNQDLSRAAPLPRDPTLTALPRASTSNDLLGKHTV